MLALSNDKIEAKNNKNFEILEQTNLLHSEHFQTH